MLKHELCCAIFYISQRKKMKMIHEVACLRFFLHWKEQNKRALSEELMYFQAL
jgi:hypothetical protein